MKIESFRFDVDDDTLINMDDEQFTDFIICDSCNVDDYFELRNLLIQLDLSDKIVQLDDFLST